MNSDIILFPRGADQKPLIWFEVQTYMRTFEDVEIFILSSFSVDYIIIKLYSKKTIYYHH